MLITVRGNTFQPHLNNVHRTPKTFYRTGSNSRSLWNYNLAPFPKLIFFSFDNINSYVVTVKTYVSLFIMKNLLNSE